MTKGKQSELVAIAVGGNIAGPWGSPLETIETALKELCRAGIRVVSASKVYRTPAMGYSPQPEYLNAVILVKSPFASAALMRRLKAIEKRAGRRAGKPWAARPLDLDILSFRGSRSGDRRTRGTRAAHQARPLMLPHPGLENRAFVLVPLRDVAPFFRSLTSGRTISQLIHAQPAQAARQCIALEFKLQACDT